MSGTMCCSFSMGTFCVLPHGAGCGKGNHRVCVDVTDCPSADACVVQPGGFSQCDKLEPSDAAAD
jgi:hypothetical protein